MNLAGKWLNWKAKPAVWNEIVEDCGGTLKIRHDSGRVVEDSKGFFMEEDTLHETRNGPEIPWPKEGAKP
jgi:hypothetical protein